MDIFTWYVERAWSYVGRYVGRDFFHMISTTPDANFYVGRNPKLASGGISTFSVVVFFASGGIFYIGWHFFTSGGFFTSGANHNYIRFFTVPSTTLTNNNDRQHWRTTTIDNIDEQQRSTTLTNDNNQRQRSTTTMVYAVGNVIRVQQFSWTREASKSIWKSMVWTAGWPQSVLFLSHSKHSLTMSKLWEPLNHTAVTTKPTLVIHVFVGMLFNLGKIAHFDIAKKMVATFQNCRR